MVGRRPRIFDVASEAGVSVGTVSRILNGDQTVRSKRREAVLAAIDKLGYHPDPVARAMRSGSTRTIGITVRTLRNYSVATFVETILESVAPEGYAVSIADTAMRRQIEATAVEDFQNRHFDGVIALSPYSLRTYRRADEAGTRALAVYSPASGRRPPVDMIELDYGTPAAALLQELFDLGHRRINFIGPTAAYRVNPLLNVPLVADGSITVTYLADTPSEGSTDEDLVRHVVRGGASALILRAESAPHVLGALRSRGIAVPRDVSVALWGHAPWRPLVEPRLSSVEIDHRAVGAAAARHLLARLRGLPCELPPPFRAEYLRADSLAIPGELSP
jgi:LacI family transcriptional regulator